MVAKAEKNAQQSYEQTITKAAENNKAGPKKKRGKKVNSATADR